MYIYSGTWGVMEKGSGSWERGTIFFFFLYPSCLLGLEEGEVLVPGMKRCSELGVISVFPLGRSNTDKQIKSSKSTEVKKCLTMFHLAFLKHNLSQDIFLRYTHSHYKVELFHRTHLKKYCPKIRVINEQHLCSYLSLGGSGGRKPQPSEKGTFCQSFPPAAWPVEHILGYGILIIHILCYLYHDYFLNRSEVVLGVTKVCLRPRSVRKTFSGS